MAEKHICDECGAQLPANARQRSALTVGSTVTHGRVTGKIALVTGAGSGIGLATALLFARRGAKLTCADIATASAEDAVRVIEKEGGEASACHLDVASEADWQKIMEQIVDVHGRLDIVVNCAGISFAAPVAEMRLEDWRRVMAVNLDGIFLGTKYAILAMRKQLEGGTIINVSSASGLKSSVGASAYSASKAAVCMFTKTVAKECHDGGDNIRLNTVCPAGVKTPMWRTMPFFQELMAKHGSEEAAFEAMEQSKSSSRFAEPGEIASAILYLASGEARLITGTDLVIDDGYTL